MSKFKIKMNFIPQNSNDKEFSFILQNIDEIFDVPFKNVIVATRKNCPCRGIDKSWTIVKDSIVSISEM